jgi:hypothetical protein
VKLLGALLVAAGVLALVYKGFDLPGEKKAAKIGTLEIAVQKKEHVEVPAWAGIVAIAVGAAMLVSGSRR